MLYVAPRVSQFVGVFCLFPLILRCHSSPSTMAENIYSFSAEDIEGNLVSMEKYRGKVVLMVNVASKCGFTKQYNELQPLFEQYREKGFAIAAFPCNQFGSQEPGSNGTIRSFVRDNYRVSFDMYSKIDVNGDAAHPLWTYLKEKKGGFIKWNFTKFLVDRHGVAIKRYAPTTTPSQCEEDIVTALKVPKAEL